MVTIPAQFNGPVRSGNGGYVCGLLGHEHGADDRHVDPAPATAARHAAHLGA